MIDLINQQHHLDKLISEFLWRVATLSAQRRAFGDDVYRPPLPIHGSARMYDRMPLVHNVSEAQKAQIRREYYNISVPTIFNEEGD